MAYTDFIQSMTNAAIDAVTLGDCINGSPDVKVKSRLGQQYWTLATINNKIDYIVNTANTVKQAFDANVNDINKKANDATAQINSQLTALSQAISTAAAQGAGQNGWTATLVKDASGKTQQQINDSLISLANAVPFLRKSIAKQGSDNNRAVLDIVASNTSNTFIDNVLTIQNKTTDGTIYGNAAFGCLDLAGNERGAFGYSRNNAIQPGGYYPDTVYVECGDPFTGDANPSDFRLIVTQNYQSPYFPATSFVAIHHDTKVGVTRIRGRGNAYQVEIEGRTLFTDDIFIGDIASNKIREINQALTSTTVRYRERNTANKFSITTNLKQDGSVDDTNVDAWEFAIGNGTSYIGRKNGNDSNPIAKSITWDWGGRTLIGQDSTSSGADGQLAVSNTAQNGTALTLRNVREAYYPTQIIYHTATTGDNLFITFATESTYTPRGQINYNRASGQINYATTSDYRSKTVHGDYDNALATINQLHVVDATMNGATQNAPMFIAHELQAVCNYAVTGEKDAVDEAGNPVYQQVDTSKLVPLLVRAVQEQQKMIEELMQHPMLNIPETTSFNQIDPHFLQPMNPKSLF